VPRDYFIRIETYGREGPDDFEVARGHIMADLNEKIYKGFELKVVDVQQLPREAGGTIERAEDLDIFMPQDEPEPEPTFDNAGYHGFEDSQVTHPWDQGLWIFPDDHPLHDVEVHVKASRQHHSPSWDKAKSLLTNDLLALPPGKEES
jgi:hypothetical protein